MWWTHSSCEMNDTCVIENMTEDKKAPLGRFDIASLEKSNLPTILPHLHPPAKIYDSKQDFLYATRSISDFFFFGSVFPLSLAVSCTHFSQAPHTLTQVLPFRRAPGQTSPVPSQVCVCSAKGAPPPNLHQVVWLAEALSSQCLFYLHSPHPLVSSLRLLSCLNLLLVTLLSSVPLQQSQGHSKAPSPSSNTNTSYKIYWSVFLIASFKAHEIQPILLVQCVDFHYYKNKKRKARLSWNVKSSKAKQETNVCSANHFLLRMLCRTWPVKGSLCSFKQIEVIHDGAGRGSSTQAKASRKVCGAPDLWAAAEEQALKACMSVWRGCLWKLSF